MTNVYQDTRWAQARDAALHRDGERCSLSRLFGGDCHATLDVHHLTPVGDGGAPYDLDNLLTVCHTHHPMLEGMRRYVTRKREPRIPKCRHRHYYAHAARECLERRMRQAA